MTDRVITGRDPSDGIFREVHIRSGYIQEIRAAKSENDCWLSPGFVDIQVNGFQGCDLNSSTVDADVVIALTRKLFAVGVTTFLPTLITASEAQIIKALRAIALARLIDATVAHAIPFVHLEGPHISAESGALGAHPAEHVRPPDLEEFDRWQKCSAVMVGLVTLSPHWPGAPEYIERLVAKGVRIALGHTHATPAQISAAVDAGASLSTHIGNGIAGLIPRHPNPIWTQLADDRLCASFIADGHHLPLDTLKVMFRAKGIDRSILISDSAALAGMSPGTYQAPIGGHVELDANGRLSIAGTEFLAGAGWPLKDGMANLMVHKLCSPTDAVRMTTTNPGIYIGRPPTLHIGARADVVRFRIDESSGKAAISTVVSGEEIWDGENL